MEELKCVGGESSVFRRETRWDERERENADISCNDDDDYYEEENDYSVLFYTMTTSY